MNVTYLGYELKRILRDAVSLFFIVGLPVFFYLVFGASMSWSDQQVGNGNVAMLVMVSMAAYGAVTGSVSLGASAAVERMQGWGRQLGLTPLGDRRYVAVKVAVAVLVAAIPILLVYGAGALTGASGTVVAWVLSGLILACGAALFALYGLIFGLAFRTEAAVSAASGSVVILGFLGNVFFPLSGTLLTIAKFTPLYGLNALARYPISEGSLLDGTDGTILHEPLWVPAANVAGWLLVLSVLATLLVRRSRNRQ